MHALPCASCSFLSVGLTILPNQNVISATNVVSFVVTLLLGIVGLALFVDLGFRKGTPGPNEYGPDPLAKA
jgi:uncharacterized membrane protein YhaH (DUF805 family)